MRSNKIITAKIDVDTGVLEERIKKMLEVRILIRYTLLGGMFTKPWANTGSRQIENDVNLEGGIR